MQLLYTFYLYIHEGILAKGQKMFPMFGYYGINPFCGWGVCPRPGIGFLYGFAAATAFQPTSAYYASGSLFSNPFTYYQNPLPITTYSSFGSFGNLTASIHNNNSTDFSYTGSYENTLPYYSSSAPVIEIKANNVVNNFNIQPRATEQTQVRSKAQPSKQKPQTPTAVSANNKTTTEDLGSISSQGVFLKGKGRGTQYGPEFLAKVKKIANKLNCNYRDLIAIFNSEFGVEANKTARNGAVGLICFMPKYFDTKRIVKMSPIEQLDVVENTIMKSKIQAGFAPNAKLSKADLYALVFLPARAKNEVLCRKGEGNRFYESNSSLDYNGDHKITKEEMAHRIDNKYVSDQSFLA